MAGERKVSWKTVPSSCPLSLARSLHTLAKPIGIVELRAVCGNFENATSTISYFNLLSRSVYKIYSSFIIVVFKQINVYYTQCKRYVEKFKREKIYFSGSRDVGREWTKRGRWESSFLLEKSRQRFLLAFKTFYFTEHQRLNRFLPFAYRLSSHPVLAHCPEEPNHVHTDGIRKLRNDALQSPHLQENSSSPVPRKEGVKKKHTMRINVWKRLLRTKSPPLTIIYSYSDENLFAELVSVN